MIAVMEVTVAATGSPVVTTLQRLSPILPGRFQATDGPVFGRTVTVAGGACMATVAALIFSCLYPGALVAITMTVAAAYPGCGRVWTFAPLADQVRIPLCMASNALGLSKGTGRQGVVGQGRGSCKAKRA